MKMAANRETFTFALVAATLSLLLFVLLQWIFPGYRLVMEVALLLGFMGAMTLQALWEKRSWQDGLTLGLAAGLVVALAVRFVRLFTG